MNIRFLLFTILCTPTLCHSANPIIQTIYTADPAPMVQGDTVYLYTTHDEDGSTWFTMNEWRVYSSKDMVNWTDHGSPLSLEDFGWADKDAWAAQCVYRNGKYYLYVCAHHRELNRMAIGVAVSDSPTGPFVPPYDKPLVAANWGDIDPTVFIDDDGQAYLYWGNPDLWYVKLNEDMISYDDETGVVKVPLTKEGFHIREKVTVERHSAYEEGPWLYKRNDLYYLLYPAGGVPEHLAYSTSQSPTGPWKYGGVIMEVIREKGAFTNHPGLIDFKGTSYLFYHNGALPGGGGFTRSVCVEPIKFNKDGSIPLITPTQGGVNEAVVSLDPFERVEAETIAWAEGVETTSDQDIGVYVTDIDNGDYIQVRSVDFGNGAKSFIARVASVVASGSIEIRIDRLDGPLLGTCNIGNTGSFQNWETYAGALDVTSGMHDVYLIFRGGNGSLFNFDWWKISTDRISQTYSFQNPDLSSEERAKDLITRLTLEEKAALMCDQSEPISRLGIKRFNWWSEALHGYANNDNVTVFPEPIGMAASFDDTLLYQIYDAVSDEARAKYHEWINAGNENKRFLSLSVWTPNVNIFRDPRWGRGQETYGEDPYLMSRMGVAVVKGLQGPEDAKYRKLLACAKHYAVHSGPEWSRHELNLNDIDPRELYETYLPAFKALVQEADVRQVMCAYQRLDDEPCCGNTRLLQRILRDEWGFDHLVVSDCGAITDFFNTHMVSSDPVHAAAKAVLAGTDVECVWENYPFVTLPEAVERDLIKETDIDNSLMRVLIGRFDLGDFDEDAIVPWAQIPPSVLNNETHRHLALDMARKSMTLLQNKGHVLPLSKSAPAIAIIGPNADDEPMLWGNYNGTPVRTISILEGIESKLPKEKIRYDKGCDLVEDKVTESYFSQCSFEGKQGFKATYWNNPNREGAPIIVEHIQNPIKKTTAGQHEFASGVKLEGFSATYETEFVPEKSEEIVFKGGATGHFELLVNGKSLQEYDNWRTLPSRIPFEVEAGKPYRIVIRYAQLHNWQANIEFNFGKEVDVDYTHLIQKLDGIDLVVFVGGLSGQLEGEEMPVSYPGFKGGDRTDIELPSVQRNCLKALKDAGKKIVFVNCSGSAIALTPETESCDAILQAWYGGESGGQAVADVLFGDYNPSGKLPITFYKSSNQLNDFEDYSMEGRTYRYTDDALFPFGYGLSYTQFEIGNAELSRSTKGATEPVQLRMPVSNIGKRTGTEIVQVYVRKINDPDGPLKTLRGFKRIKLAAGETQNVIIDLPASSFEFYDRAQRRMAVTRGDYEIFYGSSSDTEDLKTIEITIH